MWQVSVHDRHDGSESSEADTSLLQKGSKSMYPADHNTIITDLIPNRRHAASVAALYNT